MAYLLPAEYGSYGLPAETPDDVVAMASAVIDAHCRRVSLAMTEYVERLRITAGAQTVRLSYGPLVIAPAAPAEPAADGALPATSPLLLVRARYARPRRGELCHADGLDAQRFQSEVAWAFGLPGTWTTLDPTSIDIDLGAGELTFPANVLGIAYNEVEITYTAGFVTVPVPVQVACAQIVRNAQATPAMNVRSSRLDTMQMTYFSGSLLDAQVLALLRPYVAERLG